MKFKLTAKDEKDIKNYNMSTHILYLNKLKQQNFEVGEILVYRTLEFEDYTCQKVDKDFVEKYNNSHVDLRYIVVHKDIENNLCFIRAIKEDGKMDREHIHCTYSPDGHIGYRTISFYETDPRAVDAIIMDEEFDLSLILEEERKRKNRLSDMNRNMSKTFDSLKELNEWVKKLKAGQQLYYHEDSDRAFLTNDYKTVTLKKDPRRIGMNEFTKQVYYDRKLRRGIYHKNLHKSANCVYLLASRNEGVKVTTADLLGKAIYLSKPIDLKGEQ